MTDRVVAVVGLATGAASAPWPADREFPVAAGPALPLNRRMDLLDPASLANTIDKASEALFLGRPIPKREAARVAAFVASRQGLPRAYRGTFAPTDDDLARPLRLFTGEKVTTVEGRRHILGEEASRLLLRLGAGTRTVSAALAAAWEALTPGLEQSAAWQREHLGAPTGEFCCGTCSVALWRNLAAGGLPDLGPDRWLRLGMATLSRHRTDDAGWGRYPFHYTVLALGEIGARGAEDEIRHAAPRLERLLRRKPRKGDAFAERRRTSAERALGRL